MGIGKRGSTDPGSLRPKSTCFDVVAAVVRTIAPAKRGLFEKRRWWRALLPIRAVIPNVRLPRIDVETPESCACCGAAPAEKYLYGSLIPIPDAMDRLEGVATGGILLGRVMARESAKSSGHGLVLKSRVCSACSSRGNRSALLSVGLMVVAAILLVVWVSVSMPQLLTAVGAVFFGAVFAAGLIWMLVSGARSDEPQGPRYSLVGDNLVVWCASEEWAREFAGMHASTVSDVPDVREV